MRMTISQKGRVLIHRLSASYPKAENFGADNLVYHHFNRLDIEVYTDYKDPDMEATIEEVLTAHELYYEKSEVWIETEKMYEVLYELTV